MKVYFYFLFRLTEVMLLLTFSIYMWRLSVYLMGTANLPLNLLGATVLASTCISVLFYTLWFIKRIHRRVVNHFKKQEDV